MEFKEWMHLCIMKAIITTIILCTTIIVGFSQVTPYQVPLIDKDATSSGRTITKQDVTKMPNRILVINEAEYPGGVTALESFLRKNLKYPNRVPYQGKMVVRFKVTKKGNVKDITVTESPYGAYVNNKLIQAIERMPKWIPATYTSGVNKTSYMEIPIYISCVTKMNNWDWRLRCAFYPVEF